MRTNYPATWFRLYAEFATDPKVQMLSEIDQRRYVMLLCFRCSNGCVTLQDDAVAFQLRVTGEEWSKTKTVLMQKNLIDDSNKPVAWDKRQRASDTSAERVAKHREAKKHASNVYVTLQKRQVETETETEITPLANKKPLADTPPGFAEFWSAYPKKVGKGEAEKVWRKAGVNGHLTDVLSAVAAQKQSDQWKKDNGQYIPNPATWINQRRWEDGESTVEAKRDWI